MADAVEELTRLYRELSPRPAVEEVEAAAAVLASADAEEEARLAEIAREEAAARARAPAPAPARNSVRLRALQQRKEAVHVVELERRFKLFDDLIQRASRAVSPGGGARGGGGVAVVDHEVVEVEARRNPALAAAATEIDRGSRGGLGLESTSVSSLRRAASAGTDTEKLGLIQVASLIESSAKKGTTELNLRGKLKNLRRLIAETNELEELPYTIGSCTSLVELRLDFNQLKALPEAIGKLEILTLHYNRIKGLPTTIGHLTRLRELDVSFNEVETIPDNICFAASLVKLNVSRNFADLRALPKSIGELEMLEELDISSNQIRVLPDSFGHLSKLRVFLADETPLEVPPKEVVKLGAQELVNYMKNMVAAREVSQKETDKRSFWTWLGSLFGCCKKNQGLGPVPV
ncbi:unnamed protein product [Miscanthus lutarioriparius]|uniref:Uncharacterized protein n=1 Tax=Miscanthus lutarioriparius TaxID=422564 RepID=A0A811MX93_9POAL|nr:unnamed protein product [Miscanthus lutarioriparius]